MERASIPSTVHGVPLASDEHVLALDIRLAATHSPIPAIIVGILLLPILLGVLILYRLITEKDKMRYVTVLTNKRVFESSKSGRVLVEVPIGEIDTITVIRRKGYRRGFSLSAKGDPKRRVSFEKDVLTFHDAAGRELSLEDVVRLRLQPAMLAAIKPIAHHP